jgi:hypothetical protein
MAGEARIGRLLEPVEDGLPGGARLSHFVASRFHEVPEHRTEFWPERFDVQVDVQVLRGAKLETRPFHRERRGRAADQHVLIGAANKVCPENIESPHHGKRPFSSSRAS